ncbi:MAG TPA: hypothetical protein VFK42_14095 [Acidimicrobiales bacterium]|jgi:hypothetical protein|nr:hypothetical protein [Acidimicrobiales bacterium]
MALPKDASSHHTVWVTPPGDRVHALRYATAGDHLYCFGDDGLGDVGDGTHVDATLHRIANGPPVAAFGATVRTAAPDEVELEAVLELLAHVALGRTLEEVEAAAEDARRHRRIVELVA